MAVLMRLTACGEVLRYTPLIRLPAAGLPRHEGGCALEPLAVRWRCQSIALIRGLHLHSRVLPVPLKRHSGCHPQRIALI
jgi:hypothetical protein